VGFLERDQAAGELEKRELKRTRPGWRARRWVVEACHSWLNRNRALLTRWSKKRENHLELAAGRGYIAHIRRRADVDPGVGVAAVQTEALRVLG
jgi:hypothetical protein